MSQRDIPKARLIFNQIITLCADNLSRSSLLRSVCMCARLCVRACLYLKRNAVRSLLLIKLRSRALHVPATGFSLMLRSAIAEGLPDYKRQPGFSRLSRQSPNQQQTLISQSPACTRVHALEMRLGMQCSCDYICSCCFIILFTP